MSTSWDPAGRPSVLTDAKGQPLTFSWSNRDEITGGLYSDGTRWTAAYDAAGRTTRVEDWQGVRTLTWDALSQLLTENGPGFPGGHPLSHTWDSTGNRIGLQTWRGVFTYSYDPRDQMVSLADPGFPGGGIPSGITSWSYDARGAIVRRDNPNGTRSTTTWDAVGQPVQILHSMAGGVEIERAFYGYGPTGMPSFRGSVDGIATWSYDALDQLVSENLPGQGLTTWTYDASRRRLTQVSPTGITTYAYDPADQMLTAQLGTAVTSYSWDANGCQVRAESPTGVTTFSWDPQQKLRSVALPTGSIVTSTYRSDGRRHSRQDAAGTETLLWDGPNLLAINGPVWELFSVGPELARSVGEVGSPATAKARHYHLDALDSVQAITDAAGATETRYLTDAWGNVLSGSATDQPLVYGGGMGVWREGSAGLLQAGQRWVDPATGRWLSSDPVEGEPRYLYTANAPTAFVDPDGTEAWNPFERYFGRPLPAPFTYAGKYPSWRQTQARIQSDLAALGTKVWGMVPGAIRRPVEQQVNQLHKAARWGYAKLLARVPAALRRRLPKDFDAAVVWLAKFEQARMECAVSTLYRNLVRMTPVIGTMMELQELPQTWKQAGDIWNYLTHFPRRQPTEDPGDALSAQLGFDPVKQKLPPDDPLVAQFRAWADSDQPIDPEAAGCILGAIQGELTTQAIQEAVITVATAGVGTGPHLATTAPRIAREIGELRVLHRTEEAARTAEELAKARRMREIACEVEQHYPGGIKQWERDVTARRAITRAELQQRLVPRFISS